MTENDNEGFSNLIFYGVGLFFLLAIYEKAIPFFERLYQIHQTQILIAGGVIAIPALTLLIAYLWNRFQDAQYEKSVTARDSTAIPMGTDTKGKIHYMKQVLRTSHTQVIGTTSSGKTESVILPWIIQDIKNGSGVLIIDGKSDSQFLEKLYSYVVRAGRKDDFRLFSLANIEASSAFNPLQGGSPQEVAERVFSSFSFENEYYRNVQYKILLSIVRLIYERQQVPTFQLVHRLLTDSVLMKIWLSQCTDKELFRILTLFNEESVRTKSEKISGLDAHLTHFSSGDLAVLFSSQQPAIDFNEGLQQGHIFYFQLPTMYYPFLAEATGKLALQSFQSAVSKRHLGSQTKPAFYSCYLDDFQDYIYAGFGALLNKSRSANIGMVFSHQALGDLDKVSAAFRNVVMTNTNIKIVMRNNDPETCDHFAKSFGTRTTEKATEKRVTGFFGETRPGEGSVRKVEEFIHHPNDIKQLRIGEGIVTVPHPRGVKIMKIRFDRRLDLPPVTLPSVKKSLSPITSLGMAGSQSTETV